MQPPSQADGSGEFRALAEHLPDGVARFDPQLRYVYANPAFQAATGLSPAQLLGHTLDELAIFREVASLWNGALQQTLSSGKPHVIEYWRSTAEGERRFETRLIPEFASTESVESVLTVTRDVTERFLANAAQREDQVQSVASETRMRAVFDSTPLGIFVADSQGNVTFANRPMLRMANIGADESLGTGWLRCLHPDDVKPLLDAWHAFVTQKTPDYDVTYRFVTPAGERHVRAKGSAIGEPHAAREFVGTVEDITERLQLEEQLRTQQKMEVVGRLAGGVAHDFNNLLTVILNGIGILKSRPLEDQSELLRQVELAAERAAALTRQLLAFGRKSVLHPKVVDVNILVRDFAELLRRLIGENVHLVTSFGAATAPALVDTTTFEQALMNLVLNARDASPPGKPIALRVERRVLNEREASQRLKPMGRYVGVRVEDQGPGITSNDLPHIFEPFYTTKALGRGTGLGLAMVHGIVEQHRGWVEVETELGRGTTFSVYVPEATAPAVNVREQDEAPSRGGSETILLVEDEPAVRAMIRASLERSGYHVLEAADGAAAKRIWSGHAREIDLLLTDLVMPGHISGRELAVHLRAERPQLPVVIMSGYGGHELSLESGMRFLQKPFPMKALESVLRACLEGPES